MSADLPTLGKPITTALTGRGFSPLLLRLALISALASIAAFFTCTRSSGVMATKPTMAYACAQSRRNQVTTGSQHAGRHARQHRPDLLPDSVNSQLAGDSQLAGVC